MHTHVTHAAWAPTFVVWGFNLTRYGIRDPAAEENQQAIIKQVRRFRISKQAGKQSL